MVSTHFEEVRPCSYRTFCHSHAVFSSQEVIAFGLPNEISTRHLDILDCLKFNEPARGA